MLNNRVLLVEDEDSTREIIKFSLVKAGFYVVDVNNGKSAIAELNQQVPDIVITDLVLPDLDGYSFIKHIKSVEKYKELPLIVVSGKDGMEEYLELEFEEMKPDMFVNKPFKIDDLINKVIELTQK